MNAWTDEDASKPWGCEIAALRHMADNIGLNTEQAAMLRHCAKRIESTAALTPGSVIGTDQSPVPTEPLTRELRNAAEVRQAQADGLRVEWCDEGTTGVKVTEAMKERACRAMSACLLPASWVRPSDQAMKAMHVALTAALTGEGK